MTLPADYDNIMDLQPLPSFSTFRQEEENNEEESSSEDEEPPAKRAKLLENLYEQVQLMRKNKEKEIIINANIDLILDDLSSK